MGNVLFRWPDLEHISSPRVLEYLGTPEKGKISKKDGTSLEKGLPEYLVEPIEYERQKDNFFTEIQLVDFGECRSPCEWLALPLIDSHGNWFSIFYLLPTQTAQHPYVASSSGVGIPT